MKLALVILAVEDVPRAAAFYREAFGWRQVVDVPVYAEMVLDDGMRVGLYVKEGFARNTNALPPRSVPGAITATELYFHVEDLDAAALRLQAAGARILSPAADREWGDRAAYFADPDGNVVVVARPIK